MNDLLFFLVIFFGGSILGYIIELFFRRLVHKKWVNPGFLVGPYLPIYGFGLCALTLIYLIFIKVNTFGLITILLMGFSMIFIEFISGLIFIKHLDVKLWDYSSMPGNYKGIICPQFSVIWISVSTIYYYFIAGYVLNAQYLINENQHISFILGILLGVMIIDVIYSFKILSKITRFAKENNLIIKYEDLKKYIRDIEEKAKNKYSFIFPFKQSKSINEYLKLYKRKIIRKFKLFKK